MFDYTGLFIGDGSVLIDKIDDDTLESVTEEVAVMYDLLREERHNRIITAYEQYRRRWIRDHIPDEVNIATHKQYRNRDLEEDVWTFQEWVDTYGYTNQMYPVSFEEWLDNYYEGGLTYE